jgi:pimeloyl-ACP methyl ester carboxylesterase
MLVLDSTSEGRCRVGVAELRYLRTGAGRPVVLLHTLRTQADYFGPLLERLDMTDLDVIAVDLPGHGRSSAPAVEYDAGYFSDAVATLIEKLDLREITLVGDSSARWSRRWSSSPLARILFTAILWPAIGPLVAGAETRAILRRVLYGGLYDRRVLNDDLLEELFRCGSLPGHARALGSLSRHWRSWIAARSGYPNIALIRGAEVVVLARCGHFASLEQPDAVARLIAAEA